MKFRINYVSNSSSCSFLIAYDPVFLGNLYQFFKTQKLGCNTRVQNVEQFIDIFGDEKEKDEYRKIIKSNKNDGKQVVYLTLDYEYCSVFTLLQMINESNGGNKMKVIKEWN